MSSSFLQRLEDAAQKHQQALDLKESKREEDVRLVVQQFIDSHLFPFTNLSDTDVKQTILEFEEAVVEHVKNHGKQNTIVFYIDNAGLGNFLKIHNWLHQFEADFDNFTAGDIKFYARAAIYNYVNANICTFVDRFQNMWLSLYPSYHLDVFYGKSSLFTDHKFKHSSEQPIRTLEPRTTFPDLAISRLVLYLQPM